MNDLSRRRFIIATGLAVTGCSSGKEEVSGGRLPRCYIYFAGHVLSNTGVVLKNTIETNIKEGFREFYIIINSTGGIAIVGIGIYNYLMSLRFRGDINVITHNIYSVESAAVDIFMAGQTRLMNKDASFLLHASFANRSTPERANELNEEYLELRQIDDVSSAILAANTTMKNDIIESYEHDRLDHRVKYEEALGFGIVNRITNLTIPEHSNIIGLGDSKSFVPLTFGPEIGIDFTKPKPPSTTIINGPNVREQIYIPT